LVEKINDSKHKKKLAEVLLKNCDAFAKNKLDLGSCSVISHKIYTTGAKPIRQPLRRTPGATLSCQYPDCRSITEKTEASVKQSRHIDIFGKGYASLIVESLSRL
jgi:hypothetical protein